MSRKLQFLGLATLSIALSMTTASGVLALNAPTARSLDSLGTASSAEEVSAGLTAEAHVVERNETGNLLSITWSLENSRDEAVNISWLSGTSYMYDGPYYSGVTAEAPDASQRFHPVMDGAGNCVCSGIVSADFKERLNPDDKVAYWSMFSVPDDVEEITLEIPGFEPIEDIPIS